MKFKLLSFLLFTINPISFNLLAQDLSLNSLISDEIIESSGLIYLDGKIITHTDSGGEAALYEIDSLNGNIIRTVYISNASNIDWEDLSADQAYIYIGDFGNNSGSRTDLKIYRLSIHDYNNSFNDTLTADIINFSYSNQSDFTIGSNNTNFDAEAMICFGNELIIFSKNWLNNKCDVYSLSKIPGTYSIAKTDSINSQGLITGASYNIMNNSILLCGYGPPIPFVIKLIYFNNELFSNGIIQKYVLQVPSGSSVQIEAITHKQADEYFLSAETSILGDAALFSFDARYITGQNSFTVVKRRLYPNPVNRKMSIDLAADEHLEIYTQQGLFVLQSIESKLSLIDLSPGYYFLLIKNGENRVLSRQTFVKS
jgi:hypothetical protein